MLPKNEAIRGSRECAGGELLLREAFAAPGTSGADCYTSVSQRLPQLHARAAASVEGKTERMSDPRDKSRSNENRSLPATRHNSETTGEGEEQSVPQQQRFKIETRSGGPLRRGLVNALGKPLGTVMGLHLLNDIYDRVSQSCENDEDFLQHTLDVMQVSYNVSEMDMARIPKTGPAVVVANHPFGAIEGVLLMLLLQRVRPDFKVLGNYFLRLIPEIKDKLIFVDNFGRDTSMRSNIGPMKESMRCLRKGHLLAIFPAGEVSHMTFRKRRITDPVWSPTVARIIRKTQASVVPVYFHGRNSLLFQTMGLFHPRFRTVMLPREFANKQRSTLDVSIGSAIPFKKLSSLHNDKDLVNYLRLRTYVLKQRYADKSRRRLSSIPLPSPKKGPDGAGDRPAMPVAPGVPPEKLEAELHGLPDECLLHENGNYNLYACKGDTIPSILKEIGRLREMTFRLVGEGTGKDIDLDRYDIYYDHLFIWQKEKREIVGAYRIGKTDEIIQEYGIDGLYTSSLFTFKPALFEKMGKALEMGRSFIRPEYQKSYNSLFLLWKGIGCYVLRNPEHIVLFGPVSISNDYSSVSKELIVRYLKTKDSISKLHKLIKPKTPPKLKSFKRHELREFKNAFRSVEDVTEVITDLETQFKGIPVLLRQYLKLGGKVLAFNVDPDFQDCLDGLIKVDVLHTPPRILATYMGKENVELLLEYHEAKRQAAGI